MAEQNVEKGDQGKSAFRTLPSSLSIRSCYALYSPLLAKRATFVLILLFAVQPPVGGRARINSGANSDWLVSWALGSGNRPEGEAAEVAKEGEVSVENHKGNAISKETEPENPAVHIARSGNDVAKNVAELQVEDKVAGNDANGEKMEVEMKDAEENGEVQVGEKRDHESIEDKKDENGEPAAEAGAEADGEEPAAKKQKTDEEPKKGRGRPKKGEANGAPKEKKAPAKKREPKKAATETGEPRRSTRIKSS
jgi:hypothetical protein